jgi:hypothetical protein
LGFISISYRDGSRSFHGLRAYISIGVKRNRGALLWQGEQQYPEALALLSITVLKLKSYEN